MKKRFKYSIILGLIIAQVQIAKAQYVLKEADAHFELFDYAKAIALYTAAFKKKKTIHTTERLAESYRQIRNYEQAESWYAMLVQTPGAMPDATLNYAKALQNNSKYNEAKIQFERYAEINGSVSTEQKNLWLDGCDSAIKWMQNPKNVSINNLKELNSPQSDWGAVKNSNGIIFTSDRTSDPLKTNASASRPFLRFDGVTKMPDKKVYGWTGNQYLRLYQSFGKTDSLSFFPLNPGTNYHIGSATFTADGKTTFFSITKIPAHVIRKKGEPTTINIEMYMSEKNPDGSWGDVKPFRYNNVNEYSVGDPYLTKDGKTLYFVSNMPGGKGGTDIYKCERNSDGNWGDAQNQTKINTAGNERTPAVDELGNFYFSSDGMPGMGGLDIFILAPNQHAVNMGYPLNSPQDDFAFYSGNETDGYFSSNRLGGLGSDDIYSFAQQKMIAFLLEGKVLDKNTNQHLSGAVVTLKKINGSVVKVSSDDNGNYKFNLEKNAEYSVEAVKTGYRMATAEPVSTLNLKESAVLKRDLYLDQIVIGKAIKIENIYYDFDKANIRPDAAKELDKLVAILKENPTIWIELGSHTDSRGNDQYNQWLSQSRANSAVQYIIDNGIDKSRITAKGYGESMPVNECKNGIRCNEDAHQLNRRTEFTIIKQ